MKKIMVGKGIIAILTVLMAAAILTGCGKKLPATAFTKGVYYNYAKEAVDPPKTYFYVFNTETYGFTADGEHDDAGVPFNMTQTKGKVSFSFGGDDGDEDVFIVKSVENGVVYGYFEDDPKMEMVFEPVPDAEPDGFSAVNYLNAASGEDLIYRDANGWSVMYDSSCITVNGGGPETTFVYTGDCPGTCMIDASYNVGKDAKKAAEDLKESYGGDATVTECIFPGTEDVKGYFVNAAPSQLGPGLYQSAYIRDLMDGYLTFEQIVHVGGDEEMDMAVSDALAGIIDSLKFD